MIPQFELADPGLVELVHAAGKKVMVWTVNHEARIRNWWLGAWMQSFLTRRSDSRIFFACPDSSRLDRLIHRPAIAFRNLF